MGASPARNLEHAFNQLDPLHAITPEEVPALFVERPHSPSEKLCKQLQVSRNPVKLLFVGHSGAGKSSEMSYLSTRLTAGFLSIPIPLHYIFRSPAVSHTEVLLAMSLRLLKLATDEHIIPRGALPALWQDYLRGPYRYFRSLLLGTLTADEPEVELSEVSLKLSTFAGEFESKIGVEPTTREKVREQLQARVNEMIEQIRQLVTALEASQKKRVLFLVEDLDKFDHQTTCDLFLQHSKTLTSPNARIIYSFPVAMRYTDEFFAIKRDFDEVYLLPNVALRHRDGSPDPDGLRTMREILGKRVGDELFDPDVADTLIALSGGHVKSLIQLARQAVLNALVDEAETVSQRHVADAASKLRDDYITRLFKEQLETLRRIRDDPDKGLAAVDGTMQKLLYNGSLLEYGNTRGPWGDINPIVLEILNRDGR